MSWQVKSALVMAAVTALAGLAYVAAVAGMGLDAAPPLLIVPFVLGLTVLSVVAQIALALISRRDAGQPPDERERQIAYRGSQWSGVVLATGIVLALGHYLVLREGNALFHLVVGSLVVAQLAEYGAQIVFSRVALR